MGLRKKPQEIPARPAVDERRVEQFIDKGGSVAVQEKKRAKTSNFPLRFMQDDMPERIEAVLSKRPLKPSMNLWINEAILDKLKAEE